jgi:hypothetical protein
LWAAIGGAGREFELRGAYVSKANIQEVSDYVLSDEGAVIQTRLWVSDMFLSVIVIGRVTEGNFQDESVEILSRVGLEFGKNVGEMLSVVA